MAYSFKALLIAGMEIDTKRIKRKEALAAPGNLKFAVTQDRVISVAVGT